MAGPAEVDADIQTIVRNVLDIDQAQRMGLTVTIGEISAVEFAGLQMLHEERDKQAEMDRHRARTKSAKSYF